MDRAIATRAAASMTQESGFHMNERNCRKPRQAEAHENEKMRAYLKERVLLLALELVGAEKFETAVGFVISKTGLVALKELEDVVDDDRLEVDLVLVVKIFRAKLDLMEADIERWK